ncbi:MAG: tRNA guanosine(34) transglycosylase Tgt [Candidatus Zixiibacteriota bacterium]
MKYTFATEAEYPTTRARTGEVTTAHGTFPTPAFMPVGTAGAVKAVSADDLEALGFDIILGNTYHLYLRPGTDVIEDAGGLHRFNSWKKSILTDSGGFQVFSLGELSRINDEGVTFKSHLDGSSHLFTPEKVVDIQRILHSDIMMPLDQCVRFPTEHADAAKAVGLTLDWLARSVAVWWPLSDKQALFGIVQGSTYKDLRTVSAERAVEFDLPGYAVGGLSVGEPNDLMLELADHTVQYLPEDRPRYLMGLGTPVELLEAIALGYDMFDCVLPTRNARNATLLTTNGRMIIKAARYKRDFRPIDEDCGCLTCRQYHRAYLRHLFNINEPSALRLSTIHNLHFTSRLMQDSRKAIADGRFGAFLEQFKGRYVNNDR